MLMPENGQKKSNTSETTKIRRHYQRIFLLSLSNMFIYHLPTVHMFSMKYYINECAIVYT